MNGGKDSTGCSGVRDRFTEYLDGRLTGREMQRIAAHLASCLACQREWAALKHTQGLLAALGPAATPCDLMFRIRAAVNQERARQQKSSFEGWKLLWSNTVGPFLLQAAAGFVGAVLLMGSVILLFNFFAQPESARAAGMQGRASGPRFLYMSSAVGENSIGALRSSVVVEVSVNEAGAVYDYRIVSGPNDAATRSRVETMLLWSRFEPARRYGQPVAGLAVLSFSGVSVRG